MTETHALQLVAATRQATLQPFLDREIEHQNKVDERQALIDNNSAVPPLLDAEILVLATALAQEAAARRN